MRNKIYYNIIKTGTHLEYHVSADKEEAKQGKSMSRRIKLDHPELPDALERWLDEVVFYGSILSRDIP